MVRGKTLFLVLGVTIIAITLLAACAQAVPPTPTQAPSAATPAEKPKPAATAPAKEKPAAEKPAAAEKKPQALQKIKMAYTSLSVLQALPWLAKERGLFEKYGLDVDFTFIQSTPPATAALLAGDVQMLVGAQEAVVSSGFAGSDLEFIASGPTRVLFYMFGAQGIDKLGDLKGKKYGITKFGTSPEFATKFGLRQAGLEPGRDVALIQVGTMPDILTALTTGAVQGGTLSPPTSAMAKKQGFKMLYDFSTANYPIYGAGIIVRKSWVPGHEETIRNFLKAYIEATALARKDKEGTLKVIGKYTKVSDTAELSDSYDAWMKITPDKPYPAADAIKTTLDDMPDEPKAKNADPNQFFDRRFIEELDKSGFIDSVMKK